MAVSCCWTLAVWTAAAQSAFVCQYDGMNETNRVAVKSVKVAGPNRTLTWKADRDYPQCGVGFEFTATDWSTNNYVFAPAAIYDGNRFDISYVRYAPYITDWEMPRKPNRPVVTTNIHHLHKNGTDARIDFLAIVAERLGRGFKFDPVTLRAVNDEAADRFLYQSMRQPWANEMWG